MEQGDAPLCLQERTVTSSATASVVVDFKVKLSGCCFLFLEFDRTLGFCAKIAYCIMNVNIIIETSH